MRINALKIQKFYNKAKSQEFEKQKQIQVNYRASYIIIIYIDGNLTVNNIKIMKTNTCQLQSP